MSLFSLMERQPIKLHHGVVRSDKATTKLRVVCNASSTSGLLLNDCIYKGPKFHQHIRDLLIRLRSYKVALIADVEEAFLMIAVDEKDRDESLSYMCTGSPEWCLACHLAPFYSTQL